MTSKCDQIQILLNLVTPKAGADLELLIAQTKVGLLSKSSRLAQALGVATFTTILAINSVTLCGT